MIDRTGLYALKQDLECRCADSRWTAKNGTQFEVTNVNPDKRVFYSYALGGWHCADIESVLVIPYQCEKVDMRETGDGESYFISHADCELVGNSTYKGKAIKRLAQYEKLFSIEPIELHMLFEKMKVELENLRDEKKQLTEVRRYGYNPLPTPKEIKRLKKEYPTGCRVIIHHVSDPYIYIQPETMATVHGVDKGGLVHVSCDDGTCFKLILKADQFERTDTDSFISTGNVLRKRIHNGYLYASVIEDETYPGIDVEYVSDVDDDSKLSCPRVLIEWPEDGNLRALIWNDLNNEDYTKEIVLSEESRCLSEQ